MDVDSQKPFLQWRLNGHVVCKAFYKVSTCVSIIFLGCKICLNVQAVCAIPTKMFDSVVNQVLSNQSDDTSEPKHTLLSPGDTAVLGFLDAYFTGFIVFSVSYDITFY